MPPYSEGVTARPLVDFAHLLARAVPLSLVIGLMVSGGLAGCADEDPAVLGDDLIAATPATTTQVTTTTTDRPVTTDEPVGTAAVPTASISATTTTVPIRLPVPQPPPEPRIAEPYLELGRIEIPKLRIDQPLLEGVSLTTLDRGPGHWPGTAMPGEIGNVVVAGHRTSHGRVFRHLDQLLPGDEVVLSTASGRFRYVVSGTSVVTPDAMYVIDQTPARTATLFACHPPGSTRQRIVVHLQLADG